MAKSYYAILGIHSHASQEDVKAAFRRLAKAYHPDRYPGEARPFQDVQEAYSVLGDESKRRAYDDRLSAVRRASAPASRAWPEARPVGEPMRERRRAPEPLVPEDRPIDADRISPMPSRRTLRPAFDRIVNWRWSNFANLNQPKPGTVRSLTLEIPLTPEQCWRGGAVRVMAPARAGCPVCRGIGGIGAAVCGRCGGDGALTGEVPINVAFPAGLAEDHAVAIPLGRFGIRNLDLTVLFRPTWRPRP